MNASQIPPLKNLTVLWRIFKKYRGHVVILTVLGFVGAILEGIGINAIVPLASFITSGGTPTDFISRAIQAMFSFLHLPYKFSFLLGFILMLFMGRAIVSVLFGYLRGLIVADFMRSESRNLMGLTLHASWPFLLRQKLGHVHSTLVRDLQMTSSLLSIISQIIQSFTGLLMYLLVAINISPIVTLSTAIGGAVLMLIIRPLSQRLRNMGRDLAATEKKISQFLSEHIIGMKAVKVAGAENRALSYVNGPIDMLRMLQTRVALIQSASAGVFQPFSIIFVLVLFALTYQLPGFSFVSFAAALYLVQKIFTYLESGQGALNNLHTMIPYAENMMEFKQLLARHAQREGEGTRPFAFTQDLAFKHVSFSYAENTRPVLEDVSFSVKKGSTVGIMGPSGAGKTSIADIILRLFHPTSGQVMLDGVPLEDITLDEWRSHVGYVAQDLFMMNGSIEENIRFYRPELSEEDIIAATKQANIYEFIMTLPEGLKTHVGDRGVMLSGGQRQRVALARALAGKPELLILDEATSALDSASEKLIQESIRALHGDVTVVIIAHRLTTIEHSDRLLVLEQGRITEEGTPQELLERPDSYFAKHHDRGGSVHSR